MAANLTHHGGPEGVPCPCGNRGCLNSTLSNRSRTHGGEAISSREPGAGACGEFRSGVQRKAVYNWRFKVTWKQSEFSDEWDARWNRHRRPGECAEFPMYVVAVAFRVRGSVLTFIFEELRQRSMVYAATARLPDRRHGAPLKSNPEDDEDHHHARAFGERCGIIWRARLPMTGNS